MPVAQKAKVVADSLRTILRLSNTQYNQVYYATLEGIKKAAPIVQSDCNKISKAMKLKSVLGDAEDKLKTILTKSQFDKYESSKEKMIAYYKKQGSEGGLKF